MIPACPQDTATNAAMNRLLAMSMILLPNRATNSPMTRPLAMQLAMQLNRQLNRQLNKQAQAHLQDRARTMPGLLPGLPARMPLTLPARTLPAMTQPAMTQPARTRAGTGHKKAGCISSHWETADGPSNALSNAPSLARLQGAGCWQQALTGQRQSPTSP